MAGVQGGMGLNTTSGGTSNSGGSSQTVSMTITSSGHLLADILGGSVLSLEWGEGRKGREVKKKKKREREETAGGCVLPERKKVQ